MVLHFWHTRATFRVAVRGRRVRRMGLDFRRRSGTWLSSGSPALAGLPQDP